MFRSQIPSQKTETGTLALNFDSTTAESAERILQLPKLPKRTVSYSTSVHVDPSDRQESNLEKASAGSAPVVLDENTGNYTPRWYIIYIGSCKEKSRW